MAIKYSKIEDAQELSVFISPMNKKMGGIHSVSLPRIVSCPVDAPCKNTCMMRAIERRPTVERTYQKNFECYTKDPEWYFISVTHDCMGQRYFRWNVCGDIPDEQYLLGMLNVAKETPHCLHLVFTKRYEIINSYLDKNVKMPDNVIVIFSRWEGYLCDNKYNLPESWVDFKNKELPQEILTKGRRCSGNCSECNIQQNGCFQMKHGDIVILDGK